MASLTNKKIGIIGAGQLARLLVLEGHKLGLSTYVMSENADDPAAQVTNNWQKGLASNLADIHRFASTCDVLTLESEFLPEETLQYLSENFPNKLFPSPKFVLNIQDRLPQKMWLKKNKIPTVDFIAPENEADLLNFLKQNPKGIVIKKRRLGYDGYGTFILRNLKQMQKWLAQVDRPLFHAVIAESFIPFSRELAITFAGSGKTQIQTFPLVEWQAKDAKCFWVKGPLSIRAEQQKFLNRLKSALKTENYFGAITFELFQVKNQLVVNEIAPRVHNAAHYSIEALNISQFQAHLLGVLQAPLPAIKTMGAKGFAMVNLIGSGSLPPRWSQLNEGHLHWYNKTENRPGRKMGHITCLSDTAEKALKIALQQARRIEL